MLCSCLVARGHRFVSSQLVLWPTLIMSKHIKSKELRLIVDALGNCTIKKCEDLNISNMNISQCYAIFQCIEEALLLRSKKKDLCIERPLRTTIKPRQAATSINTLVCLHAFNRILLCVNKFMYCYYLGILQKCYGFVRFFCFFCFFHHDLSKATRPKLFESNLGAFIGQRHIFFFFVFFLVSIGHF